MSAENPAAQPRATDWLKLAGSVFALYVVMKGAMQGFELLTGHKVIDYVGNPTAVAVIGIAGNITFAAYYLYSFWESRHLTLMLISFATVAAIIAGIAYVAYRTAADIPDMGHRWIETYVAMPAGSVYRDPFSGEMMVKELGGSSPLEMPLPGVQEGYDPMKPWRW